MAENAYLTNHWVFSLHYFCNDVHLAKEHQCTKKYLIWCSGWSDVEKWQSKVGSTPWKTEHVRRNGQGSSSGANKNSEQCSPLGAKIRACPFRRTCSIHILKRPFYLAQSAPSGIFLSFVVEEYHGTHKDASRLSLTCGLIACLVLPLSITLPTGSVFQHLCLSPYITSCTLPVACIGL